MKNRIILDTPWRRREGNSLAQTWGYVAERLFVDEADVANSPVQSFDNQKAMAGDIKYKDINGDGQITETDMVPIGYPTSPEIIYGFGFLPVTKVLISHASSKARHVLHSGLIRKTQLLLLATKEPY